MLKKIHLPWPVIVCTLFVFIFTNLFSLFIFGHIPRVHDELDYLFQAKIYKSGRAYVPSPCAKEFFDLPHMVNNGKWYSQYTPGYPFLMLLGLLLGAPWIINPLLAAFSIILFFFIGKEIYDSNVGILAALLGAVSLWFLLMSSTMMSHTSCLFFTALFLLFLFRSIKNPSVLNGIFAGIGLGMSFLIRTYDAFLASIPFLIYLAVVLLKDFRKRLKNAVALALITLVFISVLLIYNQVTNDHPLRMGYIVSYGENHSIGFGKNGYTGIPHTPLLGSLKIGASFKALNTDLFGWPLSSFLALLPLFWITQANKESRKRDLLLASGLFSLTIGFYFYWGTHVFIGPRMFFEALPILFLLSARGISEMPHLLSTKVKKLNPQKAKKIVASILVIFIAYGFLVSFPRWVWPPDTEWYYDGFANNFAGVTTKIHNTLNSLHLKQALVIMKFLYQPFEYFPDGWWSPGFLYNDPYLKENIIYAQNKDENYIKLFQCFPERDIYLYLGTLEKGMLVPLKNEGNKVVYGKPILSDVQGKKYVELINDPKKFYKVYSHDFESFLDEVYQQNRFFEVDVVRLIELGSLSTSDRDFIEAAFCFEAALQIEKQPGFRYQILNLLIPCYTKTNRLDEAKIISARINVKKKKVFQIFPEKGI